MNNIHYTIIERKPMKEEESTFFYDNVYDNDNVYNNDIIETNVLYEDLYTFYMNYSVKNLLQILNYYGINKNKLLKEEMIQLLIIFELDPNNKALVLKRMRLWQNIAELNEDQYFKKFIMFTV